MVISYKIGSFIELVLEGKETIIYIGGKSVLICKGVFFNIPSEKFVKLESLRTLDEQINYLSTEGEHIKFAKISPREEFFVHCSNLQAWVESNYSSDLIDFRIAFPILRELVQVKDSDAIRVFNDEIARRFHSGYLPVVWYLISEGYLKFFNTEELDMMLFKNNSVLRASVRNALSRSNDSELAIEILGDLIINYDDINAFKFIKSFFRAKLVFHKKFALRLMDDTKILQLFDIETLLEFIRFCPLFLKILADDNSLIPQYLRLCDNLNKSRLKMMVIELLTILCYSEDYSVIFNYFKSYIEEYNVILKTSI